MILKLTLDTLKIKKIISKLLNKCVLVLSQKDRIGKVTLNEDRIRQSADLNGEVKLELRCSHFTLC